MASRLSPVLNGLPIHAEPSMDDMVAGVASAHAKRFQNRALQKAFQVRGRAELPNDVSGDITDPLLSKIDELRQLGSGSLILPAGDFHVTERLNIDFPLRLVGSHSSATVLNMASNTGIWLVPSGSALGGQHSVLEFLQLRGNRQRYFDRLPNTHYSVGDRRRPFTPATIGSTSPPGGEFPNSEVDRGIHLRCITAGTSGSSALDPGSVDEGQQIIDGQVVWVTEMDVGVNIQAAFCTVRHCSISFFDDNGILIFGDGNTRISDGAKIYDNTISDVDGHCIYITGDDSNLTWTYGNNLFDAERGCGIRDASFLNCTHGPNNQAITTRFPFVGAGNAARTLWIGNYAENCQAGIWIHAQQLWLLGSLNAVDSRSQGRIDDGARQGRMWLDFKNGFARFMGGSQPFDQIIRYGDFGSLNDEWETADSSDPGGYLRLAWVENIFGTRDITSSRSNKGQGKWRFPRGYYRGDTWHAHLDHPAGPNDNSAITGTTLWQPGDCIWNTDTSSPSAPWGWTPSRKGGWGGGPLYPGRVWLATTGQVFPGQGIEPSAGNGHVYWCAGLEEKINGSWVVARYDFTSTSGTEPTWPTSAGASVYEYTNGDSVTATKRIHWQEWGALGMVWNVGPLRSGTVTT